MDFVLRISPFLLLSLLVSFSEGVTNEIQMTGTITCTGTPYNRIVARIVFHDVNSLARRFEPLDSNGRYMSQCFYNGDGTANSPWIVNIVVDNANDAETNPCGVEPITTSDGKAYRWRLRVFTTTTGQTSRAFTFYASCNVNKAFESGRVGDTIRYKLVPFSVAAVDPKSVTGENAYATGSRLTSSMTLYPDGSDTPDALKGAEGYALTDCYYSTANIPQSPATQFIDGDGCPVPNTPLDVSDPYTLVGTSDKRPITLQTTIKAIPIQGDKTVNVTCRVWKCLTADNDYCDNPCKANREGVDKTGFVDTGYTYETSYDVQDVKSQDMYPSRQTNPEIKLARADIGTDVVLVLRAHPRGIGSTEDMRNAVGFAVESCVGSPNDDFDPSVLILSAGCPVTNSLVNLTSGFIPNSAQSDPENNIFALLTQPFTLPTIPGGRLSIKCAIGVCDDIHYFCTFGRCGTTNNKPNNYDNLGNQGANFTMTVTNPNEYAIVIDTTDPDGNPTSIVNLGQGVPLSIIFNPGGSGVGGEELKGAAGAYAHTCIATVTTPDNKVSDYLIIDKNGCVVPASASSPVSATGPCQQVGNGPPFTIDCDEIVTSAEGRVDVRCQGGVCREPGCNRCEAGDLDPNNLDFQDIPGTPASFASFQSKARSYERTAIRSEEIKNIIIAACIVVPLVFCGVISVLTWISLKWQKKGRV